MRGGMVQVRSGNWLGFVPPMERAAHRGLLPVLISLAVLCPRVFSSRAVLLTSIEIFRTHELFGKPSVYFKCQGENRTYLPDVKKMNFLYAFKGLESWQPLTELPEKKCKRCGIYEKDDILSDDIFDEWELCSEDFHDGRYIHGKEKEFNATFTCPGCSETPASVPNPATKRTTGSKKISIGIITVICILSIIVSVLGIVLLHRYLKRRKRYRDQARFLKLFEDDNDIEDELALENVL